MSTPGGGTTSGGVPPEDALPADVLPADVLPADVLPADGWPAAGWPVVPPALVPDGEDAAWQPDGGPGAWPDGAGDPAPGAGDPAPGAGGPDLLAPGLEDDPGEPERPRYAAGPAEAARASRYADAAAEQAGGMGATPPPQTHPVPASPSSSYPRPTYLRPTYAAPTYAAPTYPAPTYPAPTYAAPAHTVPAHTVPAHPAPAHPAPIAPAPAPTRAPTRAPIAPAPPAPAPMTSVPTTPAPPAPPPDPFGWATLGVPATGGPPGSHLQPSGAGGPYRPGPYDGRAPAPGSAAWAPGRPPGTPQLSASTRRWNLVGILAAGLIVLVVLGGNLWGFVRRDSPLGPNRAGNVEIASPAELPPPGPTGRSYPTPGFEEAGAPLGAPTLSAPTSTSYSFQAVQDGGPVAWSPCRPIHVVVNPSGAPEGFADQVLAALGDISAASGLVFVYDGVTDEPATVDRATYQPERYGDRWAPVIVRFAGEVEVAELSGDVAGLTMAHTVRNPYTGLDHIVTAEVWLDPDTLSLPRQDGVPAYVAVLRHELGHVVGLDHVGDTGQLMYPMTSGVVTFQDGDLAGLARLGEGTCARSL